MSANTNENALKAMDQYAPVEDIAYKAQKEALERIASAGPCVIVGIRADQILKGNHKVFSIFVSAYSCLHIRICFHGRTKRHKRF